MMDQMNRRITRAVGHGWAVALAFLAVGVLTYSNALHNRFLLDDRTFFFSDMKMPAGRLLNYFIPDMRRSLQMDKVEKGATYYRPLAHLMPGLCYLAFRDDTFRHHVFNLLLFVGLCSAFYWSVRLVTGEAVVAFLAGLFFCVHPLNGLMVTYITAQVFTLQLIAMLLCAAFFWKNSGGAFSRENLISLGCFGVALLCHETAMAMPFYLLILAAAKQRTDKAPWRALIPFWGALLLYALFRMVYASLKASIFDKFHAFGMNGLEYLASLMHLMGWYLAKFFVPLGIVLTWVTPPVRTHEGGYLLLFILIVAVLYRVVRYYASTDRLALGALFWFLVGSLPVAFACLFQPRIGLTFEPHWMYAPSLGFFVWLAGLFRKAAGRWVFLAALMWVVPMALISRSYNALWSDEKAYCLNWLKEAPHFRIGYFLLGDIYMREGNYARAREMFRKYGDDWGVFNNLGLVDLRDGRVEDARKNFLMALEKNPNASMVYTNLGSLELEEGRSQEAEGYLVKAVGLNRYLPQPRRLLARVYALQGRLGEAIAVCEGTLALMPDDEESLFMLVLLNMQAGHRYAAMDKAEQLVKMSRDRNRLEKVLALSRQAGFVDVERAARARLNK